LVNIAVTPFVGVWIEMIHQGEMRFISQRHSLRGSVD